LSEVENDEDIKSFKELLDNRALSFQTNPNKLNIVKAILNAFFDMNLVGESSDMEEKGPVD
jgi:hypothetical protein